MKLRPGEHGMDGRGADKGDEDRVTCYITGALSGYTAIGY